MSDNIQHPNNNYQNHYQQYQQQRLTSTSIDGGVEIKRNSSSSISTKFGAVVTFRCPLGYRLLGASSIQCTRKNRWSHPIPSCERK